MPRANKARAVFLDRDGVLNEEVDYLSRVEDLRVIPGAAQAVKALKTAGYKVIVVSNQSGVARGYFNAARLREITRALREKLAARGAGLDAVYYCAHHAEPKAGEACLCRKPGTLLLEKAAKRFKLDLRASFFVGDSTVDVKTARNAGCRALLVRTGKGGRDGKYAVKPEKTFKDLAAAARWICILPTRAR